MSAGPQPTDGTGNKSASEIGWGVFLLLAGGLWLAENMGWIKAGSWLFPVILISWGLALVVQAARRR